MKALLGVTLSLLWAATSLAVTVNGDWDSVNNAYRNAADGDTIQINSGTWEWTQTLVLDRDISIKIQGNTTTQSAVAYVAPASQGVNVNTFTGSGVLNVTKDPIANPTNATDGFQSSGKLDVATDNNYGQFGTSPPTGPPLSNGDGNGFAVVNYTGKTASTFTGCSLDTSDATGATLTGVMTSTYKAVGQGYAVDNTTINDNTPLVGGKRGIMINVQTHPKRKIQISGITFAQTATTGGQPAFINITGVNGSGSSVAKLTDSPQGGLRIDHCHFVNLCFTNTIFGIWAPADGVIDHCIIDAGTANSYAGNPGYVFMCLPRQGNDEDILGNARWAKPTDIIGLTPTDPILPGSDWFFIEDNYIFNRSSQSWRNRAGRFYPFNAAPDVDRGGNICYRYNHMFDALVSSHGTQGYNRGARKILVYKNDWHQEKRQQGNAYAGTRSGSFVAHDDISDGLNMTGLGAGYDSTTQTFHGTWGSIVNGKWCVEDLSNNPSPGYTNARNPAVNFDDAPVTNSGNGTDSYTYKPGAGSGGPFFPSGGVYWDGTVSATDGATTLQETGANWGTDQWKYFWAYRKADGAICQITGNTSNTLTMVSSADKDLGFKVAVGDHYQIRRMLIGIDQQGLGGGDTVTGDIVQTGIPGPASTPVESFTGSQSLTVSSVNGFNPAGGILSMTTQAGAHIKYPLVTFTGINAGTKQLLGLKTVDSNSTGLLVVGGNSSITNHYWGVINQNVTPPGAAFPHQQREGIWVWNEVYTPTGAKAAWNVKNGQQSVLKPGRDVFNNQVPANFADFTYPHPLAGGTPVATPAPPSAPSATVPPDPTGQTQINLSWTDNSTNENNFVVERSPTGVAGSFAQVTPIPSTTTAGTGTVYTYNNTGLSPNTAYYFRFGASNAGGTNYSATVNKTTLVGSVGTPTAPDNLTATAISDTEIDLTWRDNSNNETGFKIDTSSDGVTFAPIPSPTPGANTTTYANTGLTAETTYYYRVRATNGSGDSANSNVASAQTQSTVAATPTPAQIQVR